MYADPISERHQPSLGTAGDGLTVLTIPSTKLYLQQSFMSVDCWGISDKAKATPDRRSLPRRTWTSLIKSAHM
jgi:hypothetical protein